MASWHKAAAAANGAFFGPKSWSGLLGAKAILPAAALLIAVSMAAAPAQAMCPVMMPPPLFTIMPDDNTQGLVVYSHEDRMETLVLEPSFHGTATDFGMVLPLPNKPEITEAKESIFTDLNEITGGAPGMFEDAFMSSAESSVEQSVRVIETKDVGDFKTTTLTADSSDALVAWLQENGYSYTQRDAENFEYYVQKTGYYFVALKVNMGEVSVDEGGQIDGRLKPIEFSFVSEAPMLPFRIMASDMEEMSFTLYTISDFPYFVPGTDTSFAGTIQHNTYEAGLLEQYGAAGKWLVRTEVDFDPLQVERNVVLSRADAITQAGMGATSMVINPQDLPAGSGILAGSAGNTVDLAPFAESLSPLKQQKNGIPADSVECRPDMQLVLLPGYQKSACVSPDSASVLADMGWQPSTHRADELQRIA